MARKKPSVKGHKIADVIVNAREIKKVLGLSHEAVARASPESEAARAPLQQAAILAQLGQALRELEQASQDIDPDVLVAPRHAMAARLQSYLASGENAKSTFELAPAGGREVKFDTMDYWGWLWSLRDHVGPSQIHPPVRPQGFRAGTMPSAARVAVLGDWGTGLYGAVPCAQSIQKDQDPYWMLLHLGDIYYSGTDDEVQERFLDLWPRRDDAIDRALNANHEMFSGGQAYFRKILPKFKQKSSYFAYQNKHWLLLGLDTAYVDHDLDDEQAAWIHYMIGKAGPKRKVVLFSHHQLYSRLCEQGDKLDARLKLMLNSGRITAWYWGHEHQCIVYDNHPTYNLWARCIGHGGMPYTRTAVADAPIEGSPGEAFWRRLDSRGPAPASLVLDGPNRYVVGREDKYGPHGYATLHFEDDRLTERIHSPDGVAFWTNEIR